MTLKLFIPKESSLFETRVAATPETVRKLMSKGNLDLYVEPGAGIKAGFSDAAYQEAGAFMSKIKEPDLVLSVTSSPPVDAKCAIGMGLTPTNPNQTVFDLTKLPRISRAQTMDVLSSQSNLAGYRAVIEALYHFGRITPMMVTAAGTLPAARILIVGAGVAGLQAIATAKRLGAQVFAFDVRAAAKEQVQSLGAKFIEVPLDESGENKGGYAREMSEAYKEAQRTLLTESLKKTDILITTAQIPGRSAPKIITEEMLLGMPQGSVGLDLPIETGGNIEGSQLNKQVKIGGVTLLGIPNLAGRLPQDSSKLYAKNLLAFFEILWDGAALKDPSTDELLAATLVKN